MSISLWKNTETVSLMGGPCDGTTKVVDRPGFQEVHVFTFDPDDPANKPFSAIGDVTAMRPKTKIIRYRRLAESNIFYFRD